MPDHCPHARPRVRGRLAPSPTGHLHLGNAFAFLIAWLQARSRQGDVVLRMEDIDPARSRPEYATAVLEDLDWLGLDWDEGPDRPGPCGPYIQSERMAGYAAGLDRLRDLGLVYPCYCTRRDLRSLAGAPHVGDEGAIYPGTCRGLDSGQRRALEAAGKRPCLRLNTGAALLLLEGDADAPVCFTDGICGPQRFSMAACGGDFALRRSDNVVAYQLAVALDDAAMGITHVVRGNDILASTPRQLLLLRLLGAPVPRYLHVPLVHDALGQRLAKRHSSLELRALRREGVSPRAVVGFLAHLCGLLSAPEPASPRELLPAFSPLILNAPALELPENVPSLLRGL